MISTPQFQLMKNSAYIINMGRGPVLDEDASPSLWHRARSPEPDWMF